VDAVPTVALEELIREKMSITHPESGSVQSKSTLESSTSSRLNFRAKLFRLKKTRDLQDNETNTDGSQFKVE
jgi:hypothetical protein